VICCSIKGAVELMRRPRRNLSSDQLSEENRDGLPFMVAGVAELSL